MIFIALCHVVEVKGQEKEASSRLETEPMAHQRVEVLWSPNCSEEFATYCTELQLYRLQVRSQATRWICEFHMHTVSRGKVEKVSTKSLF